MTQSTTQSIFTDVAIIGGGINGVGIARELALRNVSTVVIEKNDLMSGTSSVSSKLVHGGLRYLKEGHFKLVADSLKERYFLLKNAPHLVKPLPFLVPLYRDSPIKKWQFRLGLFLYDLLGTFRKIHPHQFLSNDDISQFLPHISRKGLKGGALYYDAQMDDARLGVEVAMDASQLGASILTYTQVTHIHQTNDEIQLTVLDYETQQERMITAKYVVNASGPWSNEIASLANPNAAQQVRLSKGIHIVVPQLVSDHALLLLAKKDKRVFFVIPWCETCSLIGTTDTDYDGSPDDLSVTADEVDYLLDETNRVFPNARLTLSDVITTFSGFRPLLYNQTRMVGSVSRDYQLKQDGRLFHVIGGKYTTFRSMSELCCKALLSRLSPNTPFKSLTQNRPFVGARYLPVELLRQFSLWQSDYSFLTEPLFSKLVSRYGSEVYRIIQIMSESDAYQMPLEGDDSKTSGYIIAEIIYAIRFSFAKTITDIIRRRTALFFTPTQGQEYVTIIGHYIQQERELSDTEMSEQKKEYALFISPLK